MKEIVILADLLHASPRMVLLSKYLQRRGVNPIIITPPLGRSSNHIGIPEGKSLEGLTIVETEPFAGQGGATSVLRERLETTGWRWYRAVKPVLRWIHRLYLEIRDFPDAHRKWKKAAFRAFETVWSTRRVSVIVSSSSPVTCHVIAHRLAKRFGLPWIADLRDLWSQNHNYPHSRVRCFVEGWFERKTLRRASRIVTVTPDWAQRLRAFYGRNDVTTITNGYDPEAVRRRGKEPVQGVFRVVYTGQLYPGKQDPGTILDAVAQVLQKGVVPRRNMRVDFYGRYSEELQMEAENRGLSDVVVQHGKLPWKQVHQKQAEADVLLLLYWCDGKEKGWIPSKVFEYLVTGKPIVATGQSSDNIIGRILHETRSGVFCTSVGETAAALEDAYRRKSSQGDVAHQPDWEAIKRYGWDYLSDQYLALINQLQSRKDLGRTSTSTR